MRCWLGLNNENPTQRREDAESAKGYEDNEKKSQMLWISALFASSRLCVGFYDLVTRGRGTARSIEYKAMILFG